MSRAIIFCGRSGSGKTALARAVSKQLNVVCLAKDTLKENLYELESGQTLEDSFRVGKKAILLLLDLAEEAVQNGVDVIIESPFDHPDNAARFQHWIDLYAADVRIIICEIDEKTRLERTLRRPRHACHHDEERIAHGLYQKPVFDYSTLPGEKLSVDTAQPLEMNTVTVLKFFAEA
jgi:predicted kinase